ncbi:MAG: hypothetical protein GIW99_02440 [Candidatus Eremiobacteraeota bacterium]|nr:hypothetical protein [Candidatus Eremiobacteraeota bacterium]MBC5826534.1 hypothetical protein [Candidatus Eremiobacteraeota bacterium]
MQDSVDALIENLLAGPHSPSADAWNDFGQHGPEQHYCPLFGTLTMCSDCCKHFTGNLFGQSSAPAAAEDGYTRFRLTSPREVTRREFRRISAYACRLCPNNPLRK